MTQEGDVPCPVCGVNVSAARCDACGAAVRAGKYRVVSLLGKTDHSRTYVAQDESGEKVALKELLFVAVPTLQQLEAFEREGTLLAHLAHPRVPGFVDAFREGSGPSTRLYLAQELIEGESLAERLGAGAFDEAQARQVAREVLEALVYLHGREPPVIHRDVKPQNLIYRADGALALVDFGAAREVTGGVNHQATLVGTYGYMPPEQLAGSVDATSDLYALGATLMHLCTGRPPEKLVDDELELGAGVSLNVSPAFDRFVRKLAAKAPGRRFRSALEAQAALEALPPPGRSGRRAWSITAGLVAIIALGLAGAYVTRPAPAVKPPVPVVHVWAWAPKVTLYEAANPASAISGADFVIGTEALVDRAPSNRCDDFLHATSPREGYLRACDVRTERPDYAALMDKARAALGDARLAEVETHGELARALAPKEREPVAMLAALYGAQNRPDEARRLNDALAAFPAPPPPPPAPRLDPGEPEAGQRWYVGATRLRLRNKPSADSAVEADLAINSEVEIVKVTSDWTQVKWMDPDPMPRSLDFTLGQAGAGSGPGADEKPRVLTGWVSTAFLTRAPIEKQWALSKAEAATDLLERERLLARAAAVDPFDKALQLRLAKQAVALRDYPVAAMAAVASTQSPTDPLVEVRLAYACRGNRHKAQWIDDSADVDAMPADACVESLAQQECEPCDCGNYCLETTPCPTEADPGHSCTDCTVCQNGECVAPEPRKSPVDEYREREDARTAKQSAIDSAFQEGAWLRVKVTGPPRTEARRVIVYQYSYSQEMEQDPQCTEECTSHCAKATATVEAIDTVPVPPPGQDVTIWVHVPSYEGTTYGVAFGDSAAQVRARLERAYSDCNAGTPPNTVSASISAKNCDECHCT